MILIERILQAAQKISSVAGVVSFVLFLCWFILFILYKRTKAVTGTATERLLRLAVHWTFLLAIVSIFFFATFEFLDRYDILPRKRIRLTLFSGYVHLGDNIFARIGGGSLPYWDDPVHQPNTQLIWYNKTAQTFQTRFGLPTGVQLIANYYAPIFAEA